MRNKATLLLLSLLTLLLAGCVPPGYSFSLTRPEAAPSTTYSDEFVKAVFLFNGHTLFTSTNLDKTGYIAYDSIELKLSNRTNAPLTIDWNQVRFSDHKGNTDLPVMPAGTSPSRCSEDKPATTVRPGGVFMTRIIPCYAATSSEYEQGSMFGAQREQPEISFALHLPVSIGDEHKSYDFVFSGVQKSARTDYGY